MFSEHNIKINLFTFLMQIGAHSNHLLQLCAYCWQCLLNVGCRHPWMLQPSKQSSLNATNLTLAPLLFSLPSRQRSANVRKNHMGNALFFFSNESHPLEHHLKDYYNQCRQQTFFSLMQFYSPFYQKALFTVKSNSMRTEYNPLLSLCLPLKLPQKRAPSHHQPFVIMPEQCYALIFWRPASSSYNSISTVYYLHPNKSLGIPLTPGCKYSWNVGTDAKAKSRSGVRTSTLCFMRNRLKILLRSYCRCMIPRTCRGHAAFFLHLSHLQHDRFNKKEKGKSQGILERLTVQ